MRSTAAAEVSNDQLQQLLDRATHLPAHPFVVTTGMPTVLLRSPLRHTRIHVTGQVRQRIRTASTGELTELHQDRHPVPHRAVRILPRAQPLHIPFDLRANPARTNPINGLRLHKILLQHGDNFLSADRNRKPSCRRAISLCARSDLAGEAPLKIYRDPPHNTVGHRTPTMKRPSPPDTSPGSRCATARPSRSAGTTGI